MHNVQRHRQTDRQTDDIIMSVAKLRAVQHDRLKIFTRVTVTEFPQFI